MGQITQLLHHFLPDNVMMNEGVDDSYLSGFINAHVRGKVKFFEADMSKFDKSQNEICLEIECEFMRRLGVPTHVIEEWRFCHTETVLFNKKYGVRARVGV